MGVEGVEGSGLLGNGLQSGFNRTSGFKVLDQC